MMLASAGYIDDSADTTPLFWFFLLSSDIAYYLNTRPVLKEQLSSTYLLMSSGCNPEEVDPQIPHITPVMNSHARGHAV